MSQKNIAVLFGGRSVEHEVSIVTGHEAMNAIDRSSYNPIPVYITRSGRWLVGGNLDELISGSNYRANFSTKTFPTDIEPSLDEVTLAARPGLKGLVFLGRRTSTVKRNRVFEGSIDVLPVDVFMPVLHGTNGEDGCLQGLFELAEVPYTGCNAISSSLGMNKHLTKSVLLKHGVESLPGVLIPKSALGDLDRAAAGVLEALSLPVFVKPCNLGSSVGISNLSVVRSIEDIGPALAQVFRLDSAAIVEPYLSNLRELQVAVFIGTKRVIASAVEAPIVKGVNTAASKYGTDMLGGTKDSRRTGLADAHREFDPSDVPCETLRSVVDTACKVCNVLGCSGVVRVDFFFETKTNLLYFNEINTLPGSLSYYLFQRKTPPILFTDLLSMLIEAGESAYASRANFKRVHVF